MKDEGTPSDYIPQSRSTLRINTLLIKKKKFLKSFFLEEVYFMLIAKIYK